MDNLGNIVALGYYKNNEKDSVCTYRFWNSYIISSEGKYAHDKKTGEWVEYYNLDDSQKVKSKGSYNSGSKVGVWEYNRDSKAYQKYDYDSKTILEFIPSDKEFEVERNSGTIVSKLDRPPLFLGGEQNIFEVTNFQINYPQEAMEKGISGKVLVSFFIDVDGNTSDFKIEKSIGGGCDEQAILFAKAIPNHWIPAMLDGELVKAKFTVPVSFYLNSY